MWILVKLVFGEFKKRILSSTKDELVFCCNTNPCFVEIGGIVKMIDAGEMLIVKHDIYLVVGALNLILMQDVLIVQVLSDRHSSK